MPARILIVDDMLPSVKMLGAKLTGEYYDVLTANDGPTALEIVNSEQPDLILLDVMMPGMDGFEVCRRIKHNAETTHIPVVMVTALSDPADRVQGLEAGADEFLTKPVGDATLFARVRSLIRLKQMLDQWRLREETTERLGIELGKDSLHSDAGRGAHIALVCSSPIESANIREALVRDQERITVSGIDRTAASLSDEDPDVVIMSLAPDDNDELRLASQIRSMEATRQTPILMVGDEEDADRLIKALEIGVNDYIHRPIDETELLARVRTQVRRKRYQDRLRSSFLHQLSLALTDSLTGLHNRRYLTSHLDAVMAHMAEDGKPVSLLMVDIDKFKPINDTFGHAVGDEVLRAVARVLANNIRSFDLAARFGGEEFVVVMPDTDITVACAVAERLRKNLSAAPIVVADAAAEIPITISVGVSESRQGDTQKTFLKRADDAMYQAKNSGRDKVIPEPPADSERILSEAHID